MDLNRVHRAPPSAGEFLGSYASSVLPGRRSRYRLFANDLPGYDASYSHGGGVTPSFNNRDGPGGKSFDIKELIGLQGWSYSPEPWHPARPRGRNPRTGFLVLNPER